MIISLAVASALLSAAPARDPSTAACNQPPARIQAYLRRHQGWRLLSVQDLSGEDQALWRRARAGLCPGFAQADLDGSGKVFFAAALIRTSAHIRTEILLLFPPGARTAPERLSGPDKGGPPYVTWRAGPGQSYDYATSRTVKIPHDSIMLEQLEANSTQFYLHNGKVRSILTSY